MKVLMLNGSSRKNGCTYTALEEIGKTLKEEGIDYEIFLIGTEPIRDCTACRACGMEAQRVLREAESHEGCTEFSSLAELAEELSRTPGTVFSSLGTKEAASLSKVPGAAERIWLRVLPSVDGLKTCLEAGFPAKHIICMQGPFSKELSEAMFRACSADILLTKDTGSAGGFPEKLAAAESCNMKVFVIKRPQDGKGESLAAWKKKLISKDY